jgi:L-ascorbate metabolism protein UlaG (beta-lactamase superfamily)
MKVTWLGQAGLLFESNEGVRVMVDPYLSNSVVKYEHENERRQKIDTRFLEKNPDIMIFTHDHLDHYDPETAPVYLERDEKMTVLCPCSVYKKARTYGTKHNYVQFDCGTVWNERGIKVTAVKAVHSEPYAIGVLIEETSSGKIFYVTGDTLYNESIFSDIPKGVYALFLPINGVGNNMNMTDALRFAKRINAPKTVPIHIGMFDELTADGFKCENKVIPEIYKEIKL